MAGGLGIGLALVYAIAQLHDGRVTGGRQGLGQGCAFHVELPGARSEVTPEATPDLPGEEPSK